MYHLENDYSQSTDLAVQHPEKLESMKALFWEQAEQNNVLPLDDRRGAARAWERFMRYWKNSEESVFRGNEVSVMWAAAPPLFARDFSVTARISPDPNANGVILAVGSWFGGWSFYLDRGRPDQLVG